MVAFVLKIPLSPPFPKGEVKGYYMRNDAERIVENG
jgi:hypothetical protein